MGPCSHPRAPGFLGPWPPRGPWLPGAPDRLGAPGDLEAPSRAGGPLLGEILGTCLGQLAAYSNQPITGQLPQIASSHH